MKYWRTYQKDLIMKILSAIKKEGLEILIWQNKSEKKQTYTTKIHSLKKNELILHFTGDSINKAQFFETSKPYYAHIQVLETLFKKENYNFIGTSIESTLPNELQIYERRHTERFYFQYQDHKNLTFKTFKTEGKETESDYLQSSVLVDISTAGAGIVVPKEVKDKLAIGSSLYLTDITDQKLPDPFEVKPMYSELYQEKDGMQLYKIGLKFSDQLDSVSYKSIKSVVEKKSLKVQGLDPDRFCGLTYEEQINKINQIEQKNPQLAVNIKNANDYLDRLRYLTTQMKIELLTNVKHDLLATALRLSSKELIYDLLIEVSSNIRNEFLDKLEDEKPASAVSKAQDEVMKYIRFKEGKGEFVLSPNSFETYV
jgi:hypothetical protein